MTVSSSVSLLAQSQAQSARIKQMRALFDDLQRQATTQKKYDTYAGFGADARSVQSLNNAQPILQSYLDNIDKVSGRITQMTDGMSRITELAQQVATALQGSGRDEDGGIDNIVDIAKQNLQFIQDILNQSYDGRYIFGGSDVTTPPYRDSNTTNMTLQAQITNWLNGGATTNQVIAANGSMTASQLGLSPGLSAAQPLTARVGNNTDVDYTYKADDPGMQQILRALSLAANLKAPGSGDTPTGADLTTLMSSLANTALDGISQVKESTKGLSGKFSLIGSIKDSVNADLNLTQSQLDKLENTDPSQVLMSMQVLQTQLQASYQVTQISSQLSLVNYLNF